MYDGPVTSTSHIVDDCLTLRRVVHTVSRNRVPSLLATRPQINGGSPTILTHLCKVDVW